MSLPVFLSVPHAGRNVPPEVRDVCVLTPHEIDADGDEGAAEVYVSLYPEVGAFTTTDIARAIVDLNRAVGDRGNDGVVKTHTCWGVPVYRTPLSEDIVDMLISKYYYPYHKKLTRYAAESVILGIDCHTMAEFGPPVGPDPGMQRPLVCVSNGKGTCPDTWICELAECLGKTFDTDVAINTPFQGGFIIRQHASELPWIQLELSRSNIFSAAEKQARVLDALKNWFKRK